MAEEDSGKLKYILIAAAVLVGLGFVGIIGVAIMGGVIFTTVQDQTQETTVSGQSSQGVIIDQIGINSNDNLEMELRAQTTEEEIDVTVDTEGVLTSEKEKGGDTW